MISFWECIDMMSHLCRYYKQRKMAHLQQVLVLIVAVKPLPKFLNSSEAHHDSIIQYAVFFNWQLDLIPHFCQLVNFTSLQVNVVTVVS